MSRRGEARGGAAAGPGDAVQIDVVRHLAAGVILEMELDRVALAHADEAAGNRAAECPERVGDAFGNRLFDFDHFEFDDHLRGLLAIGRRRHQRRAGKHRVYGLALWRTEVAFHRAPGGSNRVSRRRVFGSSACGEQRGHQQRCDRIPGHEHPSPVVCSFDVTVTCRDVRHFDTDQFARVYVKYRGAPRQCVLTRSHACEKTTARARRTRHEDRARAPR